MRHLISTLDEKTSGPKTFVRNFCKSLISSAAFSIIKFWKIPICLPKISRDELSMDQQYLRDICLAISSGHVSNALAKRNPGTINHARWLTTANNILRKYVGTLKPCFILKTLANFIMKVYTPMWFHIKCKPQCSNGAKHLWKTIQLSRYLPEHLRKIIDPVIERNAYYGHPESILLAMLSDERQYIRQIAVDQIIAARHDKGNNII